MKNHLKRLLCLLIVCIVLCSSFLSVSAAGETYVLNYPIYDSTTLSTSSPAVLAPYGIAFKGVSLAVVMRKGVLGIAKGTFNNNVANGNITVLDDTSNVLSYPDDGIFVTPTIYDMANINYVLAPYGVAIASNDSVTFSFQVRPTGLWTANTSSFSSYSNNQYFTVLSEPVTEPSTVPEPSTEPETSEPVTDQEPTTDQKPSEGDSQPVIDDRILQVIVVLISVIIGILLGQAFSFWKW